MNQELILTVVPGPTPGAIEPGRTWVVTSGARLGRGMDCDVVVGDPTVSRLHARLWVEAGAWWVENLTSGNGVFIDGGTVPAGARARIPERCEALQLGGVLLAVARVAATSPVNRPLAPRTTPKPGEPSFTLVRDGDGCDVRFGDLFVPMKPLTSLVFWALAARAPGLVHEWDLLDAVGRDFNVAQAISDLRRVLRRLMDEGWLSAETVRDWIREVGAGAALDGLADADSATLARRCVLARRGQGFLLLIPAHALRTDVAG
ncbi:MAG: FHA domain-containing protein [Myxococcales bacterium]|nr:FHA domain-containing protein [Myxococcales bacterium]MCB9534447.1 FHA domain-containing protein [Myxococcales bacterium]